MSTISIDDGKLRGLLKEALIEVLEEKPELLRDMLAEAIEQIGLTQAIREGEDTAVVGRDAVLKALE
jgi:hypothetical protein